MKVSKLVTLMLLLAFSTSNALAEEVVRITSGEWPPFTSKELKHGGVTSRMVTEAFASEGIKVEYGWFPWKRSLWLAETGKWDGSFPWNRSQERIESFHYADALVSGTDVFFHLKAHPFEWESVDDLKDVEIGASHGYFYGEAFQEAEKAKKIDVHRCVNDDQNFFLVLKGRLQAVLINIDTGYEILRTHFSPQDADLFTYHPKPLRTVPHYLLISRKCKNGEHFTSLFNKGLNRLKESGKFDPYVSESRKGMCRQKSY